MRLVALDPEARAATAEVPTLCRVSATPSEPRSVTAADAALARPLLAVLLSEIEEATAGTTLAGWLRGPRLAARLPGAREAAMLLPDGPYRVVRLTLDLGMGGRQGLAILLLRIAVPQTDLAVQDAAAPPTVGPHVLGSQAMLDAVLHRLRLPLTEVEGFQVGQLVALPGVTVASVRIEAGGADLGPARLGQVAGMRAVRIEEPLSPRLDGIGSLPEPGPAGLLPGDPR